ncbi:hypothetical protein P6B95_02760 [Streptomyces atratus]|uniref:hypothetical protein n=1 Tax=Streptomyces atratus TaxID=1893 RepID=UPI002AC33E30|nr:hypothetical protein [Streptomyces atratus]WPW26474.1 hypothetical protein P6B95_02760 [Streptomyces atratus]
MRALQVDVTDDTALRTALAETAATDLAEPSVSRVLRATTSAISLKGPRTLPPFFAAATGTSNGRPVTVLARLAETSGMSALINDMAEATGIPLALGLAQLLDGNSGRPGVHPPETVIEPERFFLDLARRVPHLSDNHASHDSVITDITGTGGSRDRAARGRGAGDRRLRGPQGQEGDRAHRAAVAGPAWQDGQRYRDGDHPLG